MYGKHNLAKYLLNSLIFDNLAHLNVDTAILWYCQEFSTSWIHVNIYISNIYISEQMLSESF